MKMIVGIRYRNYTHYILYRSCLPIYGIAIVRSLSFLFLDDFERNANIFVAIESGSTVTDDYEASKQQLLLAGKNTRWIDSRNDSPSLTLAPALKYAQYCQEYILTF